MNQQGHKGLEINESTRFLAAQLRLKNQKVIFFVGAGASSASGLPLGNELRDKLLEGLYREFPYWEEQRIDIFRNSFYPNQKNITLEMVSQQFTQRLGYEGTNDFLKPIFIGKEPSWSHEVIASLAKKEFIAAILTTNFDNLFEKALKKEEVDFKVISGRDDAISIGQNLSKEVIIWKLHGDLREARSLAVTKQDVLHFSTKKKDALRRIFHDYNIVFVGYSMDDPDFLELFNEMTPESVLKTFLKTFLRLINKMTPENKKHTFYCVGRTPFNQAKKSIQDTLDKFNSSENYIQMHSDDFFNELAYLLNLRLPAVIWKGDEAAVLFGGVRGEGDAWNRDCPSYTIIFGAAPNQENYTEWEGATIRLQTILREPLKLRDRCKGASLRIEIPPIDGKGVHGKKYGKVTLYLINNEEKLKLSELICEVKGYFNTYWPHKDRYRGIYPEFAIDSNSVKHLGGLQSITLELEIESQVCMDVSRFLLYFY